jgi:phosphoglycerate dehydrogenase-like enzyme
MEERKKVLVILDINKEQKERVIAVAPNYKYNFHKSLSTVTREIVQEANIIIGNPSKDRVRGSEALEFLQLSSAGSESYVKEGILNKDVILANATGAYGQGISEYMISLVLALFRNLHIYRDNQSKHLWQDAGNSRLVRESTVLILGPGDIGGSFAKKMHNLGAKTISVRRTMGTKPEYIDEQYTNDSLDSLIPRADVIALSLPNTPATTNIINKDRIALMKKSAIVINVGRGNAIEMEALYEALKTKRIAGAGLDVFPEEPLPVDSPLWDLDNLIITPHNNGGEPKSTNTKIIELCIKNYTDYINKGKVATEVDFKTGYKKSTV